MVWNIVKLKKNLTTFSFGRGQGTLEYILLLFIVVALATALSVQFLSPLKALRVITLENICSASWKQENCLVLAILLQEMSIKTMAIFAIIALSLLPCSQVAPLHRTPLLLSREDLLRTTPLLQAQGQVQDQDQLTPKK